MTQRQPTSRRRFQNYVVEFRGRNGQADRRGTNRDRSATALIASFFGLLRGHRLAIGVSLAKSLSMSVP